jgi:hypothetical protein
MVNLQLALVPVHPPLQPVKVEPGSAFAFRVIFVPWLYGTEQLEPQLIPAGELVTVPVPDPAFDTVRVYCWVAPSPSAHITRENRRIKDKNRQVFLLMGQPPFFFFCANLFPGIDQIENNILKSLPASLF